MSKSKGGGEAEGILLFASLFANGLQVVDRADLAGDRDAWKDTAHAWWADSCSKDLIIAEKDRRHGEDVRLIRDLRMTVVAYTDRDERKNRELAVLKARIRELEGPQSPPA